MSRTLATGLNRVRQIIKEGFYSLPSYSTGTVTTAGTVTITGSGTSWLTNIKAGETFHISGGDYYHVLSVNSDTSLTLTKAYAGADGAGQSYTVTGGQNTNATIVDALNSAHKRVGNAIIAQDQNLLVTTGTITYVSGTELYALPTTNGVVKRVLKVTRTDLSENKDLHPIRLQERKRYLADSGTTDADELIEYYYLQGQYIGIVPVPTTSASANVTIHYAQELADLDADSDTFGVSDDYFELICYTAASQLSSDTVVHAVQRQLWDEMRGTLSPRIVQESRRVIDMDEDNY